MAEIEHRQLLTDLNTLATEAKEPKALPNAQVMQSEGQRRQVKIDVQSGHATLWIGGVWRLVEPLPDWSSVVGEESVDRLVVRTDRLEHWDSSLPLFLNEMEDWCRERDIDFVTDEVPAELRQLMSRFPKLNRSIQKRSEEASVVFPWPGLGFPTIGAEIKAILAFIGNTFLSFVSLLTRPGRFRWRDCLIEMVQCGPHALFIVGLLSFLIGGTLSFQGAIQLEQLGADIYVVDLVSLAVMREIGALITAVVLAGRTGAAFAAQIANMKVGGEIDALETVGIPSIDFLVLPRLIALLLMMPLMTLYADCLGMIGGLMVALSTVDVSALEFWVKAKALLGLNDVGLGIIKSIIFALLIGFAGCYRGFQSERTSAGVGAAATSAVVTGILLIIVANAILSPIAKILGI